LIDVRTCEEVQLILRAVQSATVVKVVREDSRGQEFWMKCFPGRVPGTAEGEILQDALLRESSSLAAGASICFWAEGRATWLS
jgi:hypothetical protein